LIYKEYTTSSSEVVLNTGQVFDFYAIRIYKLLKLRATFAYNSSNAAAITISDVSFNIGNTTVSNNIYYDYTANSIYVRRFVLPLIISGSHNQTISIGSGESGHFVLISETFILNDYN